MNQHAKASNTARATFDEGAAASARIAQEDYAATVAHVRELNAKLADMARQNAEAMFNLADRMIGAEAPSDFAQAWSSYVMRQFELTTKQANQLAALGQKLMTSNLTKG